MCWEEALNTVVQVAWHPVGLVWFRVSGPSLRLVFLVDPVKNVAVPSAFFRLFSEIFCIFRFFRSHLGYGTNQTGGDSLAYISAIKRTNCEAVKRHSNEFRSQTLVHRTDWTHTITYTDINHLAQLNMKNPFRSVVIYAVSGFRQPQLKRRRCRHHILVGIFLFRFSFPFSFSFFFLPARAICSKAANSSLILFCAWAFLLLHFLTFFFLDSIAIFYVWAEQFLPGFHVKQFPLLTYKFLKYFTKINVGLLPFWGIAPALSVWTPVQETH